MRTGSRESLVQRAAYLKLISCEQVAEEPPRCRSSSAVWLESRLRLTRFRSLLRPTLPTLFTRRLASNRGLPSRSQAASPYSSIGDVWTVLLACPSGWPLEGGGAAGAEGGGGAGVRPGALPSVSGSQPRPAPAAGAGAVRGVHAVPDLQQPLRQRAGSVGLRRRVVRLALPCPRLHFV